MSTIDAEWIEGASKVLVEGGRAMCVSEIELAISKAGLLSRHPSIPLEVLLTKEAAMGRKFTKVDGTSPGMFSLLPMPKTSVPTTTPLPVPMSPTKTSTQLPAAAAPASTATQEDLSASPHHKYLEKYSRLKKTCKKMIYLNAALYDEIARIEKKISKACAERKALLLKIMADQNIQNPRGLKQEAKADVRNGLKREPGVEEPAAKRARLNSHRSDGGASVSNVKARTSKSPDQSSSKSNGRKQKSSARKSLMIPPINLDSNGRPVLPLELPAGLTVYSLGEINEKPGYCRTECIYPVGYCSTREYATSTDPARKCLYTCKVSEGLTGPKFEISPDNDPSRMFIDTTPEGSHNKLVGYLRETLSAELHLTNNSDFFGLKHPVVKNLLQCSQGAQHCLEYSWCRFEVAKSDENVTSVQSEQDPATSHRALLQVLELDAEELSSSSNASDDGDD